MKRVLILGCNETTKRLLLTLCENKSYTSGICLASRHKEECDELKKLAESKGVRVTTSGIDVSNVEGAMMMIKIIVPELVINLLPPELAPDAMNLALKANASYIDGNLFNVPSEPLPTSLLSEQFKRFGDFQQIHKTAVCGASLLPGGLTTIVRRVAKQDFSTVKSVDICAVKGTAANAVKPAGRNDDDVLYSEDVKPVENNISAGKKHPVYRIEAGNPKAEEAFSISAKNSSGNQLYLSSSPLITDFLKEIPDVSNVRFFEPGVAPEEHKVPQNLVDTLASLGLLSKDPVKVGNASVAPLDLVAAVLPKMTTASGVEASSDDKLVGEMSYEIYVTGINDGKEVTKLYRISLDNDSCRAANGVGASEYLDGTIIIEAVKLMCEDKWNKAGVFTPAAFDSKLLYEAMLAAGITIEVKDCEPL